MRKITSRPVGGGKSEMVPVLTLRSSGEHDLLDSSSSGGTAETFNKSRGVTTEPAVNLNTGTEKVCL